MSKINKKSLVITILSCLLVLCMGLSFTMRNASASGNVVAPIMQDGAEVRAYNEDGKSGVRFTAFVDDSHFTDGVLNDGTIAGIIITMGEVEASSLTHAYAGKVLDIQANVWDSGRDIEGAKAFNTVVYDIPVWAYDADLTARAYVGIYNDSQEKYEYTYSENACTRSAAELASKALAAGNDDAMLYNYVDGVNADFTVNSSAEEAVELSLAVGQTINVQPTNEDLAVALTADSNLVKVGYNKITVVGYDEDNAQATITAKLGSKVKNITLTVKDAYVDESIEENVLADFDEFTYSYLVKDDNPTNNTKAITVLDAKEAYEETGATSGVVKVENDNNYDQARVTFIEKVDLSKVAGLYFTLKYNALLEGNLWLRVPKTDGTYAEAKLSNVRTYNSANGGWNKLYIPYAEFVRLFAGCTEIDHVVFMSLGGVCTYYIDEVGVINETGNVLNSFDEASDVNMVWGRFVTMKYLAPNATGYPVGVGATTGVIEYPTVDDGCPSQFYFKQFVDTSKASAIVVRMYVPNGFGDHRVRVYVNTNTGARTEITSGSAPLKVSGTCNGAFADIVVNLSGLASGTIINSIEIMRHWKVNTSGTTSYWIDSITYIAK